MPTSLVYMSLFERNVVVHVVEAHHLHLVDADVGGVLLDGV